MTKLITFVKSKGSTQVARLLSEHTGKPYAVNRVQNWLMEGRKIPASEYFNLVSISDGELSLEEVFMNN